MKTIISSLLLALILPLPGQKAFAQETLTAFNGEALPVSVVTLAKANELFQYLAKQRGIPYGYLADGCHIRTQQMVDILRSKAVLAKIVIEPKDENKTIIYRLPDQPWQTAWQYHMAPIIQVQEQPEHAPEVYVLDPSLFDRAVNQSEWINEVTRFSDLDLQADLSIYYISRTTFRPDLKNQFFEELPRRLDVQMSGFLSQISHDFHRYGAFLENCILRLTDESSPRYIRGGIPVENVEEELKQVPLCEIGS